MREALETPIAPTLEEPLREIVASDYEALYLSSQEKIRELEGIISASRIKPVTPHPSKDARPGVTAEALNKRLGSNTLRSMTREAKLAALGLDPASVDDGLLQRCFGKSSNGNDGSALRELYNTSPLRGRQLREAAILLGIYAN